MLYLDLTVEKRNALIKPSIEHNYKPPWTFATSLVLMAAHGVADKWKNVHYSSVTATISTKIVETNT